MFTVNILDYMEKKFLHFRHAPDLNFSSNFGPNGSGSVLEFGLRVPVPKLFNELR